MLKFSFQNHLNVILDFRLNFELEVLKKLENLLPIFALIALFNPFSPVMLWKIDILKKYKFKRSYLKD